MFSPYFSTNNFASVNFATGTGFLPRIFLNMIFFRFPFQILFYFQIHRFVHVRGLVRGRLNEKEKSNQSIQKFSAFYNFDVYAKIRKQHKKINYFNFKFLFLQKQQIN
jgi:hypothetical protein